MAMPDLQRYPWNLKRTKNVKDNVYFTWKVFVLIYVSSYEQEMCKLLAVKPQMKKT